MTDIKRVGVLGSGIMGGGIAQVCASGKLDVTLQDIDRGMLDRAMRNIERSLGRLSKAGKLDQEEIPRILARIATTSDLEDAVTGADLVIEAVPENLSLKKEVFAKLDRTAAARAILASNTSNLSITAIAAATERPERVIGMHWFNPPAVMRLIEIVRGLLTSDETVATVTGLAADLEREYVVCRDAQGFVTTRIVGALMVEAFRMLEEGVTSKEDIDKAVRLGLNHPMGPFELVDLTGLDTTLSVAEAMTEVYGDRFRPPNLLRNMVRAGRVGRKVGRGMYDYGEKG